jgi:hypothetical protein
MKTHYDYKVVKVRAAKVQDDIDSLNLTLSDLGKNGWEIFKILHVSRYRDNSSEDFILHYCRRKNKTD